MPPLTDIDQLSFPKKTENSHTNTAARCPPEISCTGYLGTHIQKLKDHLHTQLGGLPPPPHTRRKKRGKQRTRTNRRPVKHGNIGHSWQSGPTLNSIFSIQTNTMLISKVRKGGGCTAPMHQTVSIQVGRQVGRQRGLSRFHFLARAPIHSSVRRARKR